MAMLNNQMVFLIMWVCLKIVLPLNPMVLLIIIPIKWLFVWEYTLFSDKSMFIIYICLPLKW